MKEKGEALCAFPQRREVSQTQIDKVIRAKCRVERKSPFFSYLINNMNIRVLPTMSGPGTMCVDRHGNIDISEEFITNLVEDEIEGCLCHEVLHVVFDHLNRWKSHGYDENPAIANIASDIVVNDIVIANGFQLPDGCVMVDTNHNCNLKTFGIPYTVKGCDQKCLDEVYNELLKVVPPQMKGSCNGDCANCPTSKGGKGGQGQGQMQCKKIGYRFDDHNTKDQGSTGGNGEKSNDMLGKAESTVKPDGWGKQLLSDAYTRATIQGHEPGGMKDQLERLFKTETDWKALLQKYMTETLPSDYTWKKPSMYGRALGIYLPSCKKGETIEICVALDTSGSISRNDLTTFASEVLTMSRQFTELKVHLIQADAAVMSDSLLDSDIASKLQHLDVEGRGGTDHVCVFDHMKEKHPHAKVLICFTDGYTTWPEKKNYKWDTIWAISGKDGVKEDGIPFGKYISVQILPDSTDHYKM